MSDSTGGSPADIAARLTEEFLGAIIVLSVDGRILFWNDSAQSLFGYSASEVVGQSIFETIVPPEHAEAKRAWLRTAIGAGSAAYESTRRRKDGLRLWVDISVKVARSPDGQMLLVLNERDITRVKYQRDAQLLQTRFREVLEAAPDAIVIVDGTGRIALVNSEAERLFGYGRDELLGELVELLVPSRFHAAHPNHRTRYFDDPQTRPMGSGLELSGRRKDRTEIPVEISLSPLSIDGTTLAMAAIRDVTIRRRTEEALKIANKELEAFTYSVSHDLRAPIRQIDGFSRMLAEQLGSDLDEKTKHYLRRIQDGTQHMGRLVDDLLRLARLGRQDVRPRMVELNGVVDDVVSDMQSDIAARNVQFRVDRLASVECDPGLIKVVFTNLLSNAFKYTRRQPAARVHVGQSTERGTRAFFVKDNGVGFDMKYADKLFGVFQRLHHSEEFEGTGVGLALVQRIIHKHGGEIWASASVDEGATFFFTIGERPIADGAPSA